MRSWLAWISVCGALCSSVSAQAPATTKANTTNTADPSTTTSANADPVTARVTELARRMKKLGFDQELVVDHAAGAASVNLKLPPTQVVFFKRGATEAPLVKAQPSVALDLPLRVLVYADDSSAIHVEFDDVGVLIDRHTLPLTSPPLRDVARATEIFGRDDSGFISVSSGASVEAATATLLEALAKRGFRVPLVIDYAKRLGLKRPMRLVIFGNPNVGTPLMQTERSIALDLPQKMLVFENAQGKVELLYNDPYYLARKHGLAGQDARLAKIKEALAALAATAAAPSEKRAEASPSPQGM